MRFRLWLGKCEIKASLTIRLDDGTSEIFDLESLDKHEHSVNRILRLSQDATDTKGRYDPTFQRYRVIYLNRIVQKPQLEFERLEGLPIFERISVYQPGDFKTICSTARIPKRCAIVLVVMASRGESIFIFEETTEIRNKKAEHNCDRCRVSNSLPKRIFLNRV